MNAAVDAMARPYGVPAETQRRALPELGEALSAQLHELYARPSLAAADQVAANLDGAKRAVLRYAEAMRREGNENGGY